LAFVIDDGLSGDQLCGRYKNYSPHVARLSCVYNLSLNNSDDSKWTTTPGKLNQPAGPPPLPPLGKVVKKKWVWQKIKRTIKSKKKVMHGKK